MGCQLAVLLALALAAGAVYAWVRWLDRRREELRRLARLESDVVSLAGEVLSLRERLQALAGGGAEPVGEERATPTAPSPGTSPATAPPPFPAILAIPGSETEAPGAASDEAAAEGAPEEPAASQPPAAAPSEPPTEPPFTPPGEEPPSPARPPEPPIDWERWIGVRGAALVAGILLALAGIYFVRYWIEAGLLTPPLRVALGWIAGVGAVLGSERLRRRGHENPANALAGAGVVGLYAATWAAHDLYSLIPAWLAFGVMGLITAAGGALSWRHASAVIAVLGLVGGFATPLLVSSAEQGPLTLFGYLLLLNLGVAAVARRFGWPWLSLLGLLLTVGYQSLWMLDGLDAGGIWLALLVLGAFAAFWVAADRLTRPLAGGVGATGPLATLRQAAGLGTPFLFALAFVARADLRVELWSLLLLLGPLTVAACWLSRVHRQPALELAALGANLAVGAVWAFGDHPPLERAWQTVLFATALAGAHHLFLERDRRSGVSRGALPANLATASFLLGLAATPAAEALHAPIEAGGHGLVLAGGLALAALLLRQAALTGRGLPSALAGLGGGVGFAIAVLMSNERRFGLPGPAILLGVAAAFAIALQVWALGRMARARAATADRTPATRRAWQGAETGALLAAYPVLASLALCFPLYAQGVLAHHGAVLAFGALAALPALRGRTGLLYALVIATVAALQSAWHLEREGPDGLALALQLSTVAAFTLLPLFARPPLATLAARVAAALAGALWFPSLAALWIARFPAPGYREAHALGLLPLLLAGIALAAAARAAAALEEPTRRSALAWLGAAALGWTALAVPLQLEKEWITVAWALQALAVTALWRRLDHPGLKLFGAALHLAVFVRLALNPALVRDYPAFDAGGLPVLNWLLYTYGVPVAALLVSARLLAPVEAERARAAEGLLYRAGRPVFAAGYGLLAVVLGFAWLNLTVFDAFAPGGGVAIPTDRLAARDLALSLSWALYAFLLLGLGVARRSGVLRWISLVFLVLAIGKAFLYDLGELTDLYRVASLAGLAVTLLLVSILYQRFVFGRDRPGPPEPAP